MQKFKFFTLAILAMLSVNFVWGADIVAYTLTPAEGSNNSYAANCDVTIDDITWNIIGNSTMLPWRIGGKSLSQADRWVYSKTAIEDNITSIVVEHGTAKSTTVNSFKLEVYSTAAKAASGGTGDVSSISGTFTASSTTTFTRPNGVDWSNRFYRFAYKVTISSSSNQYFQFSEATFYKAAATPTITKSASLSDFTYEVGSGPSAAQSFTVGGSNLTANITVTAPTNFEVSKSSGSGYANSVTLTQSSGTVSNTTIYVRMKSGLSQGTGKGGNISLTSTGATTQTIAVVGTVTAPVVKYTVTLLNNNNPVNAGGFDAQGQKQYNSGAALGELPTLTSAVACDATSNHFMGWTSDAGFQKRAAAPSFVTPSTPVNGNMTLRAVWAKEQ